ncbi:MAG TPA: hypothetical protein VMM55_08035 [Thermohalobaculum sp.]|nr:hypothetical protein [Thermohalobaculum sp.]
MRLAPPLTAAAFGLLALGACAPEPPAAPPPTEVGPAAAFSGGGEMPCSAGAPTYDASCVFGISRGAGGAAALQVRNPAAEPIGIQRVLLLQNEVWTTLDGSIAESERTEDATLVVVDETEFYAVPHAALTGG